VRVHSPKERANNQNTDIPGHLASPSIRVRFRGDSGHYLEFFVCGILRASKSIVALCRLEVLCVDLARGNATALFCTRCRARARARPTLGRNRRSAPPRPPVHDQSHRFAEAKRRLQPVCTEYIVRIGHNIPWSISSTECGKIPSSANPGISLDDTLSACISST